jgi:ubiquinone/menaquinone biosynthesis C-methylase UbiE
MKKPDDKNSKKTQTSWGAVAAWYDDLLSGDDTYQSKVVLPNLIRLVAPAGKKVIDIACGQGYFSHAFAQGGAKEVLGTDISPELIKKAQLNASTSEKFSVATASTLSSVADGSFDVATIVLALQNIKELNETVKEAARVLVKGGEFVIVLNHPCFRIPKSSAWGFDEKENVQYRRVDAYGRPFSVDIDMTPGISEKTDGVVQKSNKKIITKSFHRPLQEYVKALSGAEFVVTGLEEWISHKESQPGPRAKAEDAARKEFPMFLTIVARKV